MKAIAVAVMGLAACGSGSSPHTGGDAGTPDASPDAFVRRGTGMLAPKQVHQTDTGPEDLAVADYNGDGTLDLLVHFSGRSPPMVESGFDLLAGNGDGTFRPSTRVIYENCEGWDVGDIDKDGAADIVTAYSQDATLLVHRGRGDGTFAPATVYPLVALPPVDDWPKWRITLVDLDGDGWLDVLAQSRKFPDVHYFRNNGDGTFSLTWSRVFQFTDPGGASRVGGDVRAHDLTGDGSPDLVFAYAGSWGAVFANDGAGNFAPPVPVIVPAGAYGFGDVDGNGLDDIVTWTRGETDPFQPPNARWVAWLNRGSLVFQETSEIEIGHMWWAESVAVAKLDADDRPDLVYGDTVHDSVAVLRNNGDGSFTTTHFPAGAGAADPELVDLDGDGALDVVVANRMDYYPGLPMTQANQTIGHSVTVLLGIP